MSSPKAVSESSRGDQSPKIITFYKDLVNEVDGHFMRALGGGTSSSVAGEGGAPTGSPLSENTTSQHASPQSVDNDKDADNYDNEPSSLITKEHSTVTKQSPSLNNTLAPAGTSSGCSKKEVTPQSSSNDTTSNTPTTTTTAAAIIYPDLAAYLIHPHVDSFSDAPRIHGQPQTTNTHHLLPQSSTSHTSDPYIQAHSNSTIATGGSTVLQHPVYYHTKTSSAMQLPHHHMTPTGGTHLSFMSGGPFSSSVNTFAPPNYPSHHPSHGMGYPSSAVDYILPHAILTHQAGTSNYSYDGSHHYDSLSHYTDQSCYWPSTSYLPPTLPPPPPLSHKPHPTYEMRTDEVSYEGHYSGYTAGTNSQWCYSTYPSHRIPPAHPVDNDIHHILKL